MRKTLMAAVGAVAMVAVLGGTAVAGASSRSTVSGTEHFQLMTTSATSTSISTITYGLFTDYGVDHPGGSTDTVALKAGSFKVTHSKGTGTSHFNPKTCLFQINLKGTLTIGSGTGKYTGISGTGTYQLAILGVGAKSGGTCANPQTTPPVAFHQVINGTASVTLP